jgi:methionyl-tRNA formyltransferase
LALLGAHAAAHVLDALAGGFVRWHPQEGPHSYAAKIGASDRALDAGRSATKVHDHVRAMSPRPGAALRIGDLEVKLMRTWPHVGEENQAGLSVDGKQGVPAAEGGRLFLGCGRGRLEILAVQPSGKRVMTAAEFLRGYGSRLQSVQSDL